MEPSVEQRRSSLSAPNHRWSRKKKVLTGVLIVVGIGVVFGAIFFFHRPPVIDRDIVKEAAFPVYTPKTLPTDYLVDESETKLGNGALTYTLVNKNNNATIAVTVQPLPKNFNMTKLIGNGSVSATTTKNGTLYDLSVMGNGQYLLNTGDALVFFRSSKSIDTEVINTLAANLVKQN